MREIKFRAYCLRTKHMVTDVQNIYDGMGECLNSKGLEVDIYETDIGTTSFGSVIDNAKAGDIYLMQFTGLKDKNGKEIYEGDIFGSMPELRAVVEWKEFGWVLRFIDSRMNKHPFSFDRFIPVSECVGNIYENPELLEAKS